MSAFLVKVKCGELDDENKYVEEEFYYFVSAESYGRAIDKLFESNWLNPNEVTEVNAIEIENNDGIPMISKVTYDELLKGDI